MLHPPLGPVYPKRRTGRSEPLLWCPAVHSRNHERWKPKQIMAPSFDSDRRFKKHQQSALKVIQGIYTNCIIVLLNLHFYTICPVSAQSLLWCGLIWTLRPLIVHSLPSATIACHRLQAPRDHSINHHFWDTPIDETPHIKTEV